MFAEVKLELPSQVVATTLPSGQLNEDVLMMPLAHQVMNRPLPLLLVSDRLVNSSARLCCKVKSSEPEAAPFSCTRSGAAVKFCAVAPYNFCFMEMVDN